MVWYSVSSSSTGSNSDDSTNSTSIAITTNTTTEDNNKNSDNIKNKHSTSDKKNGSCYRNYRRISKRLLSPLLPVSPNSTGAIEKDSYQRPALWLVVVGIVIVVITATTITLSVAYYNGNMEPNISVAFIGNSITFVNDLPRLMETISNEHIYQDSCLHGAARFHSILRTGNGMNNKWNTTQSVLVSNFDGYNNDVFDFGACTVEQLLFGYDGNLSEFNASGYLKDDGKNPCVNNPVYLQYLNQKYDENPYPPHWDYVIMNDQTKYPAQDYSRNRSIQTLQDVYAPYLLETGSIPVFIVTHGYWSDMVNMTGVGDDVPTFTSLIYYGYQQYAEALENLLPNDQKPKLAPVGLAFLVLWEENYDLWEKLFYVDGYHPSPHGTYLMANVLYATLYNEMPSIRSSILEDMNHLWANARKMQITFKFNVTMPIPTESEASYLRYIAERVTLQGYRPKTLIEY